jgi:hypothetical protein
LLLLRGLRGRHVVLRLRLRRRCHQVPRERGKAEHVVLLRGLRLVGVRVRVRLRLRLRVRLRVRLRLRLRLRG